MDIKADTLITQKTGHPPECLIDSAFWLCAQPECKPTRLFIDGVNVGENTCGSAMRFQWIEPLIGLIYST